MRFLIVLVLSAIAMVAAVAGLIPGEAEADHKACSHPVLPNPLTYSLESRLSSSEKSMWRTSFATVENNSGGRVDFQERSYGSVVDIYVLSSWYWSNGKTWVRMPCGRTDSIIYSGSNTSYWGPHEVMHTLALADHIAPNHNPAAFVNPKPCGPSYVGVMSYCAPTSSWWGQHDDYMFWWWF